MRSWISTGTLRDDDVVDVVDEAERVGLVSRAKHRVGAAGGGAGWQLRTAGAHDQADRELGVVTKQLGEGDVFIGFGHPGPLLFASIGPWSGDVDLRGYAAGVANPWDSVPPVGHPITARCGKNFSGGSFARR